MRYILRYLYNETYLGHIIIHILKSWVDYIYFHLLSDQYVIKRKFKKVFQYKLDLNTPKTLNEKIQWLKLFDRTSLHTLCADKFAVRKFIEDKIGKEYLIPLIFYTYDPKYILPNKLPDYPVIIKTNHNSSGGIIIRNKSNIDWINVQKELAGLLKKNYYFVSKEWQYKNIRPLVVVEKLLMDENGCLPYDYKLHCFNGKVVMIQVDIDRGKQNHYRNWYNRDWKREPYRWSSEKNGKYTDPCDWDVVKPATFDLMLKLSERLSVNFIYVRVDWYEVKGKLFFGELTFHHDGGFRPILPVKWDRILGDKLILP